MHTHSLSPGKFLDEKALQHIKDSLLKKSYSISELRDRINLKFDINIEYDAIKNVYYKIKLQHFGKPNQEAQKLFELLELLKDKNFIKFAYLKGPQYNLRAFIFTTNLMISHYENYYDMIMLDTTFGMNRYCF